VDAIRQLRPELVVLDLQLPGLDGFGVVEAIGAERMPALIFATAYDRYALRAFDAHALDYLLKPFDSERMQRALARAKKQIRYQDLQDVSTRLRAAIDGVRGSPGLGRIVVKSAGRITFLNVDEIDWIEAFDNYVQLHAAGTSHLVHGTLASSKPAYRQSGLCACIARPSSTSHASRRWSHCHTENTASCWATAPASRAAALTESGWIAW
jgi:two-component system LytT family response regulator